MSLVKHGEGRVIQDEQLAQPDPEDDERHEEEGARDPVSQTGDDGRDD